MPKPLRIQVLGGLGNQLHGLMAAYVLNNELKREVILDGRWLSWTGSNGHRKLEIDKLSISQSFRPIVIKSIPSIKRGPFRRRLSTFATIFEKKTFENSFQSESFSSAADLIQALKDNPRISGVTGHFATWDWAELAMCIPGFTWDLSIKIPTKVNEMKKIAHNYVGVHVRLGDYLNHPDLYPLPSERYFLDGIAELKSDKITSFWIYTDDELNFKELYPQLDQAAAFVLTPSTASGLETFYLMTHHISLVVANSTYSSWAAFFAGINKEAKIICPERYLIGNFNDTRPSTWTRRPN
jgi:hypothetical protein